MFEFEDNLAHSAKIKVIGIGGGGGNAVRTMIRSKLEGVEFIVANTDVQTLRSNEANVKIQLGANLTKGLGAGSNPEVGKNAAIEDAQTIQEAISGADLVFITAGMGGGTGTGAAPVIARLAKDMGILTVGVVTKPFGFEGKKRLRQAESGIAELKKEVDTLITIPNEKLLSVSGKETPMLDTFKMADMVLLQAVKGIADLITIPGLINLDFADVRTVMSETGMALMGSGVAAGENRAIEAARQAISSPLLENVSIAGATGILLNITGASNITLFEVNEACKLIQQEAHEEANIIFGAVVDDKMQDEIRVTVIATGFNKDEKRSLMELSREDKASFAAPTPKPKAVVTPVVAAPAPAPVVAPVAPSPSPIQAPMVVAPVVQAAPLPPVSIPAETPKAPLTQTEPLFKEEGELFVPKSRAASTAVLEQISNLETDLSSSSFTAKRTSDVEGLPRRRFFKERDENDLKKIVSDMGLNSMDEEYDIPAFIRRRAD